MKGNGRRILDYFNPLYQWFSRYPLLLFEALLVVAFLYGAGRPLGFPYLFWFENWWQEMIAGFSVAGLFVNLAFVGYLLDADEPFMKKDDSEAIQSIDWYFLHTYIPIALLVFFSPLIRSDSVYANEFFKFTHNWSLVAGFVLGTIAFWFLAHWFSQLNAKRSVASRTALSLLKNFNSIKKLERRPQILNLHLIAFNFILLFVAVYILLSLLFIKSIPPAACICLSLSLVSAFYGAVVFYFQIRYPGAFLIIFIALLLISLLPAKNSRFADLDYDNPVCLPRLPSGLPPNEKLLKDHEILNKWPQKHKQDPNRKLVVISTSGGGIRAAAWTVAVMNQLSEFYPDVRIITGASGGMLGAAYFVADSIANKSTPIERFKTITKESIEPTAQYLAMRDIPLTPLYWLRPFKDRGWALQDAWCRNTSKLMDKDFKWLRGQEEKGEKPSLIFSPMLAEDGRRLLISNLNLEGIIQSIGKCCCPRGGTANTCQDESSYSLSAIEFFRLFSDTQLKIGTAARMSASFPYVSPAGMLPTMPVRHVVDAGYYDNYGVNIAARWILRNLKDIRAYAPGGLALIQIRDALVEGRRTEYAHSNRSKPTTFPGLLTPVRAILNASDAAMSFRNDELVMILSDFLNKQSPGYFTTVAFELPTPASLSWYLTDKEKDDIWNGMSEKNEANHQRLKELQAWWKSNRQSKKCIDIFGSEKSLPPECAQNDE